MERRGCKAVSHEEMSRQTGFMHLVKEENAGTLKKYSINTFGCQMNENDSERLAGMLAEMGYTHTDNVEESNLIIYNTCCVRENAELKVYGHLGALKGLKRQKPGVVIAVCGCMMQQPEVVEHIQKKYRHVDLVFGTHNLYKFPELLYSVLSTGENVIDVWDCDGTIAEDIPILREEGVKAWVTIMYGCDNFCSYCIVPYVRGRERSRMPEDIISEIKKLGEQGYKEITLLGQNVNSYGKDLGEGYNFAKLLQSINEVEGIERIRFMTSHPKDLSDDLIAAIRDCDKVCEHLHLPIQSGSTQILSKMNRKYTKEQYLKLIDRIRREVPGIAITTDIIVGFPGETDEDFDETIDVMEKVKFDTAYTFLYSRRTGTPAAKSTKQVSEGVKKQRFESLVEVQNKISRQINEGMQGQVVEVLVEGLSRTSNDTYTGRTRSNKIVNFQGNEKMIGDMVKIKIDRVQTWSLEGHTIFE